MGRVFRAYCSEATGGVGCTVGLSAEESHHVRRVLRLRPGERVAVFDGRGREWLGTLLAGRGEIATVLLDEELASAVEPPVQVRLYQGMCRAGLFEWTIQKATEIGVAELFALETARSERLPHPARMARFARVALEASKQCGRRAVPRVDACPRLPEPPVDVLALVLDTGPEAEPLGRALARAVPGPVWLLCGPESGLAPDEVAGFCTAGWRRAALGPRILRAETAGIVAAAIVLHRWADLGRDPAPAV